MCSGDFGQFYCVVGSSSPLFFTGFLQAKVIKRVIRMLKTDVNNRNETAVTDERLGQERAQLVEMTLLPRSDPLPHPIPLFSFRLSPPGCVALGRRPGTHRSKLHSGVAARLPSQASGASGATGSPPPPVSHQAGSGSPPGPSQVPSLSGHCRRRQRPQCRFFLPTSQGPSGLCRPPPAPKPE